MIADERTNKLIIISDEKSFERIMEVVQQLDVPTAEGGGIHVIFLKNSSAEEMATTLSNLSAGKSGKSRRRAPPGPDARPAAGAARPGHRQRRPSAELFTGEVKITADKTQNALVVQASGADIVTVRRLIEKLDRPRRQVFVEAVIMEVQPPQRHDLRRRACTAPCRSTTKDGTGFIPIASSPGRISTAGHARQRRRAWSRWAASSPASPARPRPRSTDLGLNIPSMGVMIQALQSSSDVNVLSTPTLLAADNSEAEISVGQTVPVPGGHRARRPHRPGPTGTSSSQLGHRRGARAGGLNCLLTPPSSASPSSCASRSSRRSARGTTSG